MYPSPGWRNHNHLQTLTEAEMKTQMQELRPSNGRYKVLGASLEQA
jgi:hypothetical protein